MTPFSMMRMFLNGFGLVNWQKYYPAAQGR